MNVQKYQVVITKVTPDAAQDEEVFSAFVEVPTGGDLRAGQEAPDSVYPLQYQIRAALEAARPVNATGY